MYVFIYVVRTTGTRSFYISKLNTINDHGDNDAFIIFLMMNLFTQTQTHDITRNSNLIRSLKFTPIQQ